MGGRFLEPISQAYYELIIQMVWFLFCNLYTKVSPVLQFCTCHYISADFSLQMQFAQMPRLERPWCQTNVCFMSLPQTFLMTWKWQNLRDSVCHWQSISQIICMRFFLSLCYHGYTTGSRFIHVFYPPIFLKFDPLSRGWYQDLRYQRNSPEGY